MPNYRFTASYPRFFPDIRDVNGKSLEAREGMVVAWETPPSPAEWAETEEPVTWVADGMVPVAPEPVQETFRDEPEPEPEVAIPGVPQGPERPSEPVPVPEPAPQPEPVQPALSANWFAALSGPPARA